MMKYTLAILTVIFSIHIATAQSGKESLREGTKLYNEGKFEQAEQKFKEGATTPKYENAASYNAGGAAYKQEKYTDAQQQFLSIAQSDASDELKAKAYHNLGNTFLKSNKLENSIKAYQNSLILNPKDEETRYNLSYAVQKMQQQQQQQKEDKQDEKKEEEKKDEEKKEQPENQEQKEQQQKQQEQQKQQNEMSKKNAENILDALDEKEKGIQKKVKELNKGKAKKSNIEKDW